MHTAAAHVRVNPWIRPTADPASAGHGGCLHITGSTLATIRNSQFQGCAADFGSGKGGGIFALQSTLILDNVHVDKCNSSRGGGIFTQSTTLQIRRSKVTNSTAYHHGGGVYAFAGTTMELQDSQVSSWQPSSVEPALAG